MKVLTFVLILFVSKVFSQDFVDLANVYYRTSPSNNSDLGLGKVNFNSIAADLKIPIPLNDNNIVITGLEFHKSYFVFGTSGNEFQPMTSYGLQTGIEHKWNDGFKSLLMVINRLNGDFDNGKAIGNYHQIGGVVLNTKKRNESFSWKYGLYFNTEFFAPMVVPLFGFNWAINDKWRLNVTIPVNLELSCKSRDWFRYGLRFDGVNGSYFMDDNVLGQNFYVDRADNNAWLFSDFYITKNLVFHLKAGHSVLRKYRYFEPDDKMTIKLGPVNIGDDRKETPSEQIWFDNGWSFEGRLIFRLPLN